MKKRNRFFAAFLAATLLLTPTVSAFAGAAPDGNSNAADLYGSDFTTWKSDVWEAGLKNDWTQVSMTPGTDETSMNFAWYSEHGTETSLTYGLKSDLSDGQTVSVKTTATAQTDTNGIIYDSNKAAISGLAANTTYYYQVAGKGIQSFTTGDANSFTFGFVGDPQIGSSNELKGEDTQEFYDAQDNAVASDSYNWAQTMKKIQAAGSTFVVSAGDQIQTTKAKAPGKSSATSEIEYAGYLSPAALTSIPVATTVGNHDADNANYLYHFNVPNLSNLGSNDVVGGDYYFTYGNTLFMMLNTQDTNSAEHIEFMENTVAKNPDCKWIIVTLHQDIYGSAEHSNEPEIVNLRYALTPAFDELGVDVVLTGHDHAYSRSKFLSGDGTVKTVTYTEDGFTSGAGTEYTDDEFDDMLDVDVEYDGEGTLFTAPGNIKDDTEVPEQKLYLEYLAYIGDSERITDDDTEYAVNPSGVLYLTASSSSGSKYYDLVARQQSYIASRWQEDVPTYSLIEVTETSLTINSYRTDNNTKIDSEVTIIKTADADQINETIDSISSQIENGTLVEENYTAESWAALQTALKEAQEIKTNVNATQSEIDTANARLTAAYAGLTEAEKENGSNGQIPSGDGTANPDNGNPSEEGSQSAEQTGTATASSSTKKSSSVKTGDNSSAALWTLVCAAGMGAVVTGAMYRKNTGKKREM